MRRSASNYRGDHLPFLWHVIHGTDTEASINSLMLPPLHEESSEIFYLRVNTHYCRIRFDFIIRIFQQSIYKRTSLPIFEQLASQDNTR